MKKRIDINLDNPSKAEEIEVLTKIRDAVAGKDLYLASLFSDDMVAWVTKQIQDDIMPDLYGCYENEIRSSSAELGELRRKVSELESMVSALRDHLEERLKEIESLREQLRKTEEDRDAAYEQVDEERARVFELEAEKNKLENAIVKLKARLYDLIVDREV